MTFANESRRRIDEASEIRNSGRWASINQKIKYLVDNLDKIETWHIRVLGNICAQNFSEYLALKAAYEKDSEPSLLAWRARNLLEISVWATYCSKNKGNARVFYEDAVKDVSDIYKSFIKWGEITSQNDGWLNPIKKAKHDVSQSALLQGIESIDGAYKKVSDVADECDFGGHFKLSYKMLSKFCHPTAMLIIGLPDSQKEKLQKDMFYYYGCLFFLGAFNALEDCLSLMEKESG